MHNFLVPWLNDSTISLSSQHFFTKFCTFFLYLVKFHDIIIVKGVEKNMNRLKELRQEKGLTQQALADEIGVFYRTIQNWENGKSQIKPEKAQQLADCFGVSVGYLLGYSEFRTFYEEDFFHTTGYPLHMPEYSSEDIEENDDNSQLFPDYQILDSDNELDEIIKDTYLRFIDDTKKLKEIKTDTLVAIQFIGNLEEHLRHGKTKLHSYADKMNKITFQLLDLLDRIEQREKELTTPDN